MFGTLGIPELIAIAVSLAIAASICIPAAVIARRIGQSPWLGLLAVVPVVNVVLLWVLAFAPWSGKVPEP